MPRIQHLLLIVLLTFGVTRPVLADDQSPLPVTVGFIFPLTGPMSSFGEDIAKALPLLEQKFNSEQSKYKFNLIIEDGKFGQSNAAITAAKKLVDVNGAKFLVVGSSGEMLQISPYAEASQVLCVTGFSSHPAIKNAGDYVFRTYIDAERGIELVVDDMTEKSISRVALLTEESSFSSAIRDALTQKLGDRVVLSESFATTEGDLKTLVAKARSMKPQVYYLNTTAPGTFINLVKQLRENGAKEPFYTYYLPSLPEVQSALGGTLSGTLYLDFPDASGASSDFNQFKAAFEKQFGKIVKAPFNFKTNYNAAKVVFDSIVNVGNNPSAAKNFLYKYDSPSATGRLKFDKNGDASDLNLILKRFTVLKEGTYQ